MRIILSKSKRRRTDQGATIIEALVAFSLFAMFIIGSFEAERSAHKMRALTILERRENDAERKLLIAMPESLAELSALKGTTNVDFGNLILQVECSPREIGLTLCSITPTTDAEREIFNLPPAKPIQLKQLMEG